MRLSVAQANHVAKVFPECRTEMTDFLEASAEVVIYRQNECGSDVPPYAIAVAGTAFWIDCCETPEEATALADSLGLKVLEVRR
ncbi:hypothetical protein DM992_39470 (plasmid) [Burkholderia sp. JP2-270]|nr:hypothetical protein WK23_01890 [Burkholderia vietnamiensis]AWV05413.1 hypothetical protein DM992_39470 [Burkholderia sp. JP2-270]AOJ98338.1 hypothetical protein WK23_06600 [Burkholderia vietnamiensis]AOK02147.1 hypothetical protein WK23_25740 [Burkholderia vietnamiensis]MBR8087725.1 hypothetical protein [Burkholderia vietnamiensis]